MRLPSSAGLLSSACLAAALVLCSGCHSAYIDATVSNRSSQPLALLEVDYPSASFGTQVLAPGQDFHYRFKILGSGDLTLLYTDVRHQEMHFAGPHMGETDEGSLSVVVGPTGPQWNLHLKNRPAS